MEYEGRICVTPFEKASYKLPVVVGCPYNACVFCGLFKDLNFRELPLNQIEEELQRVYEVGGRPSRIMLGDGNAFALSAEKLGAILDMIHCYFPDCYDVRSDASVTSILQKTPDELSDLAEKGIKTLYIGVESGMDEVLAGMDKDHNSAELLEAVALLDGAGIAYGAHIMSGIAGAGRGEANAKATADILNRTHPVSVCNFSLITGWHETLLSERIKAGLFNPVTIRESIEEERMLLECLDIPVRYEGFHDDACLRIRGTLPADKAKMIASLTAFLENKAHEDLLNRSAGIFLGEESNYWYHPASS